MLGADTCLFDKTAEIKVGLLLCRETCLQRVDLFFLITTSPLCLVPCHLMAGLLQRSDAFLVLLNRELLKGEGDVIRHVSHYGYVLAVEQSYLDEFDYQVRVQTSVLVKQKACSQRCCTAASVASQRGMPLLSLCSLHM